MPRLKAAGVAFLLASPLLFFFWFGATYFIGSPPLWQLTAANFEASWTGFIVIVSWCTLSFLFHSIVRSIPNKSIASPAGFSEDTELRKLLERWAFRFLWVLVVTFCSMPSILYAFAQSLPADNSLPISDGLLRRFHQIAPLLVVLVDMALAAPLSSKFSSLSGIKADRLLMTFRLFSAWLLAVVTTIIFDENCLGKWKWTWTVCQPHSAENQLFTWEVFGEEVLNTRDICGRSETWWSDGRCSRSIIGNLTPFLLKKLLVRSTLQPMVLLVAWFSSRLEDGIDGPEGRHLKFFGRKTTGSLAPFKQLSFLTTQMEA